MQEADALFEVVTVPANALRSQEQLGTKAKFWYTDEKRGLCLFKYARPNTGEDWAEKIAEVICECLQIPHARYELAQLDGKRGVISPVVKDEKERLILGNEYLSGTLNLYREGTDKRGLNRQHTVENVLRCLKPYAAPSTANLPENITTAAETFLGYLMLDALIGNADRHHENWGFIAQANGTDVRLAPTFDHASSLGRELTDDDRKARLITRDKNRTVEAYCSKSRSALYKTSDDRETLRTLEAFGMAAKEYPKAADFWLSQLERLTDDIVQAAFRKVPADRITPSAVDFASRLLQTNRQRLLDSV